MILSALSDFRAEKCDRCGGPLSLQRERPYPVWLQLAFAASFIVFLAAYEKVLHLRELLWAWSGVQIVLGILLIRGRARAARRVLRCIRCGHAVPLSP